MTYCKEYEESNNEEEGGAEWDLEMDDDADFVWCYNFTIYLIFTSINHIKDKDAYLYR